MFVWPCKIRFLLFSGISIYDTQNVGNRKRKIDAARSREEQERLARERADADRRVQREKQERLARERADADRRVQRGEQERLACERADVDRRVQREEECLARERADADRRARERAYHDRRAREHESEKQSEWWNDWMNGDDEEQQRINNRQPDSVRDRRLREDDRRARE